MGVTGMGNKMWTSKITGYRRRGTRLVDINHLLLKRITVEEVYEPLLSLGFQEAASDARAELQKRDFDVAGAKANEEDAVVNYVETSSLVTATGVVEDYIRAIEEVLIVEKSLDLTGAIGRLRVRGYVFVRSPVGVDGIMTFADLNKPIVRVLMFSIISLLEMHLDYWVRDKYPGESWQDALRPDRVEAAYKQKDMRGDLSLVECLQYADRSFLFLKLNDLRAELMPGSRLFVERKLRYAERLRNNLAHSQYYLANGQGWLDVIDLILWASDVVEKSDQKIDFLTALSREEPAERAVQ